MNNINGIITTGTIMSDDGAPYDVALGRSFMAIGAPTAQFIPQELPAENITYSTTGQLSTKTFGGTITFADTNNPKATSVTFEFWRSGFLCGSKTTTLTMNSAFTTTIPYLPSGTYSVLVKAGRPRLNRVVRNVSISKSASGTVTTTVYTGDADGDGVVSTRDATYVSNSVGDFDGSGTWASVGIYADLDDSGEVDSVDFETVNNNLGRTHDTV